MNRLLIILGLVASAFTASAQSATSKGTAVAYPWSYSKGTDTAQATAQATVEHLARREGYSSVPLDVAKKAWTDLKLPDPSLGRMPTAANLRALARKVNASVVLYGSVKWHTRSIWVDLGPRTISTATANVYVFDVKTGKTTYKKTGVEGRSDEKANTLKIIGAILVTPLVTAVSGGPMTPQQERAVQIALARAYQGWLKEPW